MLSIGTLSFAAPWLLTALAALPVIWWILRVTPPAPKRQRFPAIAFLLGSQNREETPAHTPLWLLILRLVIVALVILGLAGPALNARAVAPALAPLTLFIDNGWPAAPNWDAIKRAALARIGEAEQANETVTLVRTAPAGAQSFAPLAPARVKAIVEAMAPEPWRPARLEALEAWLGSDEAPKQTRPVWLSDGVAGEDAAAFAAELVKHGALEVIAPELGDLPLVLRPARSETDALRATVIRAHAGERTQGTATALAGDGRAIAHQPFAFDATATETEVRFELPLEIRNSITRVEIDGVRSAGAVTLLDERWQRRAIGLVSGGPIETAQPLLGDLYYVERALTPTADLRKGEISELVDGNISVLILADVGRIIDADIETLRDWIDTGGVLVRFAGPRLASQSDELVPVNLRQGGRTMGGALSWSEPQGLGPFDDASPFFGLEVPGDVTVRRQVLAEPSLELSERTWARLADGTPLVTASKEGAGYVVLFHVTANADWSNLPLSGLFVDMLERLIDLAQSSGTMLTGAEATTAAALTPRRTLDGFGTLKDAPASALPIEPGEIAGLRPGPQHPPGLYGMADAPRALNPTASNETLTPLADLPAGASLSSYAGERVVRFGPWLLAAALLLALADGIAALALMGRLAIPARLMRTAVVLMLVLPFAPLTTLRAQESDTAMTDAALNTHLAYVVTGNSAVDQLSKAGLTGLSMRITEKTALEPAAPVALDIEHDDLTFFPLIYWPVTPEQQAPSPDAQRKLDQYLKTGGMILFDTRDQDIAASAIGGATPSELALRRVLDGLDVPPLTPVPEGHVLTRSFYLLSDFPGRFAGGRVWVESGLADAADVEDAEAVEGSINDGVSSIVIGSNDWASAWAVDGSGRPIAAVIPGGERQRELAYRFGINLAMYALTGNYKGDEVHTRELLRRLGE